jgi:L-alanine-DL-glutamate epimerase-like enolase superfamily enzyme
MLIRDIRTTPLVMPWVDAPRFALDYTRPRNVLLVEVETQSGIVGLGYLQLLESGMRTVESCIHECLKPVLLGQDATHIERLWKRMWQATYGIGRMGVAVFALSAIDIALWDALGKKAGLPLYRLWGAFREEAPAYGSGCWRGLGGDGMIAKAQDYVGQGFRAIKMQAAHIGDLRTDADNVRRMREAMGPDVDIMIDINRGWTADTAILMGRKFEDYDVYWMEEPVPPEDLAGYRRVAQALKLRVVGGEGHFTRYDLRPFFEVPCVPILQPDMMRGGLTELRKIAALADTWGLTLAPHLFSELMVQVVCSIPNGLIIEYMGWLDDIWVQPVVPVLGTMRPPERPGHGLAVKPEIVKEYRVKGEGKAERHLH